MNQHNSLPRNLGAPTEDTESKQTAHLEQRARQQITEARRILEILAQSVDAAHLFLAVMARLAVAPASEMNEERFGTVTAKLELLAYYLSPWWRQKNEVSPLTSSHIDQCLEMLDRLFDARTTLRFVEGMASDVQDRAAERALRIRHRTEIVRGSAYQEQTAEEINEIQGRFDKWFEKQTGIAPTRAQAALFALYNAQNHAIQKLIPLVRQHAEVVVEEWRQAKHKGLKLPQTPRRQMLRALGDREAAWKFGYREKFDDTIATVLPIHLEQLPSLPPPPPTSSQTPESHEAVTTNTDESLLSQKEWDALLKLLGFDGTRREQIEDIAEVRRWPLYLFPDGRVVITDVANAMDALWEAFEDHAKKDSKFYQRYQKNRAAWLEERAHKLFRRLFPAESVFSSLTYPDPNGGKGSEAELDLAVQWGPFLILVEAKSKQFRWESQRGNVARLRTDIKDNVEEAFEQALRATRFIQDTESPVFKEPRSGRELKIRKDRIDRIFLITVSLHHLAGLANDLASLQDLGLLLEGNYPLSISVADLDIVTQFCEGPDVFLHYVERRLDLQRQNTVYDTEELDFFGLYLDTRMLPEAWKQEHDEEERPFNFVSFGGFQEPFDALMMFRRGLLPEPPSIALAVPPEIRSILSELRHRQEDAGRWIAFELLGLSNDVLGRLAQATRELRLRTPSGKESIKSMTFQESDTVVCVVVAAGIPWEQLEMRLQARVGIEKYRRRARRAIGFGVYAPDISVPFHTSIWMEEEWRCDEDMERLLQVDPVAGVIPGLKYPKPNEKCFCGSGRKFKKCCWMRLERAKNRI